jgi:catechol 2,3-dioxygenase-like lactoylglutathione lyase family enzyme
MRSLLSFVLLGLLATGTLLAQSVTGVQNFIHSVENLDEAVGFYKTVFGLELNAPLVPPNLNPNVLSLVSAPKGAKFRAATFKIPGAAFGLELTEFTGIERKEGEPNHWDPGAADITFRVRDLDATFTALKKAGAQIISRHGQPVKLNPNMRSVLVRDPDGYILEVLQIDPITADAPPGNIISANMGLTVDNTENTLAFYNGLLGFDIKLGANFGSNPAILEMVGAHSGEAKQSVGMVPGTTARLELYEFSNIARKPFRLRIPDPGSVAISLRVDDVDGMLKKLKAAGVKVITATGAPIQLGPMSKNVFVEDPNGVAVELIQRAQ